MAHLFRRMTMVLLVLAMLVPLALPAAAVDRIPAQIGVKPKVDRIPAQVALLKRQETAPPVTEPPATEPPVTEPVVTEPTVTEPAATEPTVTTEPTVPEETAETTPSETQPQETIPEETIPQETVPEETVPQETVPQETVPEETAPKKPLPEVPLYFQTDYPNARYGEGTIATSGCGITALAMVATYMTGYEYSPLVLARNFGGYNASNCDRMLNAADQLQIPWKQAEDWRECRTALENGCVVIVLENEASKFTTEGHFIVITGITEEERFLVNDPSEPNYERWEMKEGFEKGFTEYDVTIGYSGGWIFNKEDMPEDPYIFIEPPKPQIDPRYPTIDLTDAELELLAKIVWVESRGEPAEGQQAVAEVVFNRMIHPDFPDKLKDVIYAPGQFRSVDYLEGAAPNQTQYDAIDRALNGPYILPTGVFYFGREAENENVWGNIENHIFCYQ